MQNKTSIIRTTRCLRICIRDADDLKRQKSEYEQFLAGGEQEMSVMTMVKAINNALISN